MNKRILNLLGGGIIVVIGSFSMSCTDFLDKKSSSAFAVPETLKDLRAMLDHEDQMNRYAPSLLEMGTDDIYVRPEVLKSRPQAEQHIYTWQRNEFRSEIASWNLPYRTIMMCNVILEAMERGVDGTLEQQNVIRGEALFVRAYAYLALSQIYCNPYDETGSAYDLGLPLRISSDFNKKYARSSVQETYDLILNDLQRAAKLLPERSALPTRPTKAAAYGALARTYLYMGRYLDSNESAKNALLIKNDLLDYNDIDGSKGFPFDVFHSEVIYHSFTTQGLLLTASRAFIPDELFRSFDVRDLRKSVFFSKSPAGDIIFKGQYGGRVASYFAGICTDELYLIRAECEARVGSVEEGALLLNILAEKRWEKGHYVPIVERERNVLLRAVLDERRKQLLRRGLRWSDLRRLNKDPKYEKTLIREIEFQGVKDRYELSPDAVQYTYPIPLPIMEWGGYEQNPI